MEKINNSFFSNSANWFSINPFQELEDKPDCECGGWLEKLNDEKFICSNCNSIYKEIIIDGLNHYKKERNGNEWKP